MCLILNSKVGFDSISKREMRSIMTANPHGVGIFWDSGNGAEVIKEESISYRSLRSLLRDIGRTECFVHFRMATNAIGGLEGAHPFPVFSETESAGYQVWVAHNGVFSHAPLKVHDSMWFVANTLRPILKRDPFIWRTAAFKDLLARAIGDSNRLAFLDSSGVSTTIGKWFDVGEGVRASNLYAWGRAYSIKFDSWGWEDRWENESEELDQFGLNATGYRYSG